MLSFLFLSLSCSKIPLITFDKYATEVLQGKNKNRVWVFLFYVPFCKKYKEYLSCMEQSQILTNGSVKYGLINCQGEANLCSKFKITEYPTIIIKNKTTITLFEEQLNPKSVVKNALNHIPKANVQFVDDFWIDDLRDGKPTAILFTKKSEIPGYWGALSRTYPKTKVQFGICNDEGLFQDYNITKVPTVVFYHHSDTIVYEGLRKIRFLKESLKSFIEKSEDKTPLISDFYVNEQFPEICYDYTISCVFSYDNFVDPKLDEVRSHFKKDQFRFFVGDTNFPFVKFAKRGQYVIFSSKKNAVIQVADLPALPPVLDRVLDGGAKWIQLKDFSYTSEL